MDNALIKIPTQQQQTLIKIIKGIYGSHLITDEVFESVDNKLHKGRAGHYIKVLNTKNNKYPKKILKVWVKETDFETIKDVTTKAVHIATMRVKVKSDAEILTDIRDKFKIMEDLTVSCAEGVIKGLVVSGAPGTGKSYNVQRILEETGYENIIIDAEDISDGDFSSVIDMDDEDEIVDSKKYYIMCKGRVTPLALYKLLYDHKDAVIVFDDCDSVLYDETSLNILKAALDSYTRRIISWNSKAVGFALPRKFEFTGRIVFISNLYFDQIKEGTKLRLHIDAIMSRCHFLDLGMSTNKERILRIKQSIDDGLLNDYSLTSQQKKDIIDFIIKHQNDFREISLRSALKIAETMHMSIDNWQKLALLTTLGGRGKAAIE